MDVITTHVNADFDAVASMLAAKKLYPEAKLAFPGSQEKGLRDFFLQSTFYVLETERVRKIDFDAVTRLILVDIRQADRIGKFKDLLKRPGLEVHIYDHHSGSGNDIVGSLEVIKETGATTTILCQILQERNIPISADEATVMMMGIYEDTGSLTFSSTTVDDYLAAAFLLSQGANLNVVADMVSKELTAEQISLLHEMIHTAAVYRVNGTDVVIAKATSDTYVNDFAILVHKLRDIENINVLFVLAQMEDRIYLVARSRIDDIDVSKVTMEFGGGGHATAASATIKEGTLEDAEGKLRQAIQKHIRPTRTARQVMCFPVVTVRADESITAVGERIAQLQLSTLPVVQDTRMVGIVNRPIIDRALAHHLGELPVREYMITDFATVTPDTPLDKVQRIIIESNQGFIPVLEEGRLAGVITRTDILRSFQQDEEKSERKIYDFDYDLSKVRSKNLLSQIKEQLPPRMLELMKSAGILAEEMGYQAFAVGGFVRDILLRRKNLDLDLVVEGNGIQFVRRFVTQHEFRAKYHRKFGTAQIITPMGLKIDVASARREYYESPAALPVVELSSIRQDLYRRDFTVNTLAIRLNPDHFGELIDFFGGRRDLKNRIIKVIHNLSFIEDPTRIFRALRFEQRFRFVMSKETEKLIRNAVRMEVPLRLSAPRLFSELLLILQEENPASILRRLVDFDLLKFFFPQITYDQSLERMMSSLQEVISWFELLFLPVSWERWKVYFLGLIDPLEFEEAQQLSTRFTFMKRDIKRLFLELNLAKAAIQQLHEASVMENSTVYSILRPLTIEAVLYCMAKTDRKDLKKQISNYIIKLRSVEISLTGNDLKNLGLPPGRIYKKIMENLMKARLDGMLKSRDDELRYVKENYIDTVRSEE
ncbi:MAG TPA: CBS domain-containing protein [Thermodesulfobacteriota bacterium]|nr:CBS domain-containing protein [Thermodesulfobacteriota bacterium]HNU72333.1 CBS domain-containing protein [Thermodesulfobacteriota bacterium]